MLLDLVCYNRTMSDSANRKITKIVVDANACIGAATCVALASQAFQLTSQGIAEILPTAMNHTDEELIDAAKSCPTGAIKLIGQDGNEIKL